MTTANDPRNEDRAGTPDLDLPDSYDILDTLPESGFDNIVELATAACGVPVALVGFVDGDRLWFKARVGFPHCEADLNTSLCAHTLAEPDILVIPDLTADPRTCANPLVTGGPHLRFYAGAPIRNQAGHVVGSLCVIDHAPRPGGLTAPEATVLRSLARQVTTLLEMRQVITRRDIFIARRRKVEERLGASAARLRISEAHWRGLFERLNEGFVIAEPVRDAAGRAIDWRYLDANAAWGELVGVDPAAAIGRTVREVIPGIEEEWITELAEVVETGESLNFTQKVGSLNRWYEGRAFPLGDDSFAVLFLEVTGRIEAEIRRDALLEIGDRLRDLTSAEDMMRIASGIIGASLGVDRACFGRLDAELEFITVGPDWCGSAISPVAGRHRFAVEGDVRDALLRGDPVIVTDTHADGRTGGIGDRWLGADMGALVSIPVQERGRTVAMLLVHGREPRAWAPEVIAFLRDVADRLAAAVSRVEAAERQRLLNQELSHRMKNMLAMIQAIANQTMKGVTEQDAVDDFQQRLLALSSAHDVLLQTNWVAAPMRDVVDGVLGRLGASDRLTISGASITLGPRATLSTSLVLHELATNAAKYGALSVPAGRVTAAWHVDDATRELVFTWEEAGGPAVREPVRKGFGSRLIRSGLIGTGGVSLRYTSSGLQAEMRAGLEQVQTT